MNIIQSNGKIAVNRISMSWLVEATSAIDRLKTIVHNEALSGYEWIFFSAKNQIELIFAQSVYSPHLRISRDKAHDLHDRISAFLKHIQDGDVVLVDESELWMLNYSVDQFKTVFMSELSTLPTFLVQEKEGYDINRLIDDGAKLFPPSLLSKVPEARADAMEAGKALAFELATSCGFHIFRVTESVLKKYWNHVSSNAKHPFPKTIGKYVEGMEKGKFGDAKVVESLKQLAKLHRNPIAHPEIILSVEEAIDTVCIARSVVGAMLKVIPDAPLTTSNAPLLTAE
jgi:hypothetical protein